MGEGGFVKRKVGLRSMVLWLETPFTFKGWNSKSFSKTEEIIFSNHSHSSFQWIENLCDAGAGSYHCMLVLREHKLFSIIKLAMFSNAFTTSLVSDVILFFFSFLFLKVCILFIYLFIFGCVGSSFLCEGFL